MHINASRYTMDTYSYTQMHIRQQYTNTGMHIQTDTQTHAHKCMSRQLHTLTQPLSFHGKAGGCIVYYLERICCFKLRDLNKSHLKLKGDEVARCILYLGKIMHVFDCCHPCLIPLWLKIKDHKLGNTKVLRFLSLCEEAEGLICRILGFPLRPKPFLSLNE